MKIKAETYIKNIPIELKNQNIWGLWDLEQQGDRLTKVPYNAMTNKKAKSNDTSTWCSFKQAIQGLKKYNRRGLAIFLGGGLCGLDVDHVDKELDKHEKHPNSDNLVNRLKNLTNNSYMEVSQSGAGIHVLFKGLLPKNVNNHPNNKPYEMYDHGRFFALTGNLVTDKPEYKLLDGKQVLNLVNSTVGVKQQSAVINQASTNDLSIDEIINKILASDQGVKFKHLMDGDLDGYTDQSSADIALCNILAFWTNKDPLKMDAIFRQSKLYRAKWDTKHRSDGATYGQMTIERAIEDTSNGYNMNQKSNDKNNLLSLAETVNNSNQTKKAIPIDSAVPVPKEDTNWQQHFIYNKPRRIDDIPTIKSTTVKNALLILTYDPNVNDLFKYNEFTQNVEVENSKKLDLTKYGSGVINFPKGKLQDIDAINFGVYCESHYQVTFKSQLIFDAIEASARQHAYNPVVDYMNEAEKKWDGKNRLNDLFPKFLGADKNETTNLITELWFLGGIAKTYNPTAKFDLVLDLVGGQGTGKTTLLQKIAPRGMYTDQFTSFTDKDDLANMKDAFIVNDDEMDASNKSSFAEIKKFVTLQKFSYRKPYGKVAEEYPKHFILARTTNDKAHLRDRTGDRRFMTILVNQKNQKKLPFKDLTEDYVLQLWGEAVHLFKSFEVNNKNPFILNDHQESLLKANRDQFRQTTALQDAIEDAINDQFAYTRESDTKQNYIVPSDLAQYVFDDQNYFVKNKKASGEVNGIMESLGYSKKPKKINHKLVKCFVYVGE